MTDKINELKALIETLDAESTLRKSLEVALEEALQEELNQETEENDEKMTADAEETTAVGGNDGNDADASGENVSAHSSFFDDIADKLDELLEDDEFIAASAGFLLGAVTVGAGALAISALKK